MNLDDTLAALQALDQRKRFEKWRYFMPVGPQEAFLNAGAEYPERMLMAGNGNGKTETAAFEISRHLTGEYPTWWKGFRFTKPTIWWVGSVTGQLLRDGAQEKLFGTPGDPEAFGTGFIPKDAFVKPPTSGRSAPNAIDSALIKHVSGGISRVVLKTYEQGRENWQAGTVNGVWFDEEPPQDVFSEGMARLRGTGITLITFTPLKGVTQLVRRYKYEDSPDRFVVYMRLADCAWMTDEAKRRQVEMFPVHEREARINGMPMLGEGAVFSTPIEGLQEPPIDFKKIPRQWFLLWAIDFGIDHPFAAVLLAWDKDVDTIHILHGIRMKGAIPLQHAAAIKQIGANVPVAWPHDGNQRDKGSGEPLAAIYRKHGLKMLGEHATFSTGGYSFEGGIMELENRMTTGRFKVNQMMSEWSQEYSSYHREKGLVVKVDDDLLSATRIGVMAIRHARQVALGSRMTRPERNETARDVDFPLFA